MKAIVMQAWGKGGVLDRMSQEGWGCETCYEHRGLA